MSGGADKALVSVLFLLILEVEPRGIDWHSGYRKMSELIVSKGCVLEALNPTEGYRMF